VTTQTEVRAELDPISQTQEQIDKVQAGQQEADPMAQMQQAINDLTGQVRGFQSRDDAERASIRKEVVKEFGDRFTKLEQTVNDRAFQENLETIPEEQRPMFESLHRDNAQLKQQLAGVSQTVPEQTVSAATEPEIRKYVEGMGVNPDDPRVNYLLLGQDGNYNATKMVAFTKHLQTVQTPTTLTTQQSQQTQTGASPPMQSGPAGGSALSGDAAIEALDNQLALGQITVDAFKEQYKAITGRLP
jgi:hypothetical protein